MNNFNTQKDQIFVIKVIQSGEIKSFLLSDEILSQKFKDIYFPIIKRLKLKKEDIFLSNDAGKALSNSDLILSLKEIIQKFGHKVNLYYEKIM